jgi:hypothetical protein
MLSRLRVLVTVCSLIVSQTCFGHTPSAFSKEKKGIIAIPVLSLYEECDERSPFVSQALYGHVIYLVDQLDDGWALVELEDGYQGYALQGNILPDNPIWRTDKKLSRICSIGALVYPEPDTSSQVLLRLPFDARIVLEEDFYANNDRWLKIILANGATGWIQRGDVEPLKPKSLQEITTLSSEFLGLPYIWGGASSEGYDCSGFIQTLFKQMGVILPRDSRPQAACEKCEEISFPQNPGDIVFFGEGRITHVGLYLGDDFFIHSGVWPHKPKINRLHLSEVYKPLLLSKRIKPVIYQSETSPINEEIKSRMDFSWNESNPVPLEDLRYVKLNHWGFDGCVHDGELIVHKEAVDDIVEIFEDLFHQYYPIEKMLLVDSYQANDELSCEDNNSYAFCSRKSVGKGEWSYHSYGLAIDINPLLNPYHRGDKTIPVNGIPFLNRKLQCRGLITEQDPCYKAFTSRGWKWGGQWEVDRGYVDYQHFYKEL